MVIEALHGQEAVQQIQLIYVLWRLEYANIVFPRTPTGSVDVAYLFRRRGRAVKEVAGRHKQCYAAQQLLLTTVRRTMLMMVVPVLTRSPGGCDDCLIANTILHMKFFFIFHRTHCLSSLLPSNKHASSSSRNDDDELPVAVAECNISPGTGY
jgi:hypothetical protein